MVFEANMFIAARKKKLKNKIDKNCQNERNAKGFLWSSKNIFEIKLK